MSNAGLVTQGGRLIKRLVITIARALPYAMEEGLGRKPAPGTEGRNLVPRIMLTGVGPLPTGRDSDNQPNLLVLVPLLEPTDLLTKGVEVRTRSKIVPVRVPAGLGPESRTEIGFKSATSSATPKSPSRRWMSSRSGKCQTSNWPSQGLCHSTGDKSFQPASSSVAKTTPIGPRTRRQCWETIE